MDINNFKKLLENFSISMPTYNKAEILMELVTGEVINIRYNLDSLGAVKSVIENDNVLSFDFFISERLGRLSSLSKSIFSSLKNNDYFVSPNAYYELNWAVNDAYLKGNDSVYEFISKTLRTPNQYETHVIYLTSNAGEGKTTIIEKIAKDYSKSYKINNESKIIVPISLSGKPFIRFDDLIIGTIVNRFKFSGFYYNSFIELVKLGYIIPAFDGFEEMFIETPSGAAINSMAEFIKELDGHGTVLVAARSAYYEYQNLTTQSKIFDSLSNQSVAFSKINIHKWTKENFIEHGLKKALTKEEGTSLYDTLSSYFGKEHPVLTRAVLINKVFDLYEEAGNSSIFTSLVSSDDNEFYQNFINALLCREANKWIMKGEGITRQVLTVSQHKKLLGMIAREMWTTKSEILRYDLIDMITDLFIEDENLDTDSAWQIKNRIKDHAFLKISDYNKNYLEFDHQNFYQHFLGEAIFLSLEKKDYNDIFDISRRGRLPQSTIMSCSYNLSKNGISLNIPDFMERMTAEQKVSYAKENISLLLLFTKKANESIELNGISFESEPFNKRDLANIIFNDCIISSLIVSRIKDQLEFKNCKIIEIEIDIEENKNVLMSKNTEVNFIYNKDLEITEYSPILIKNYLENKLSFRYEESNLLFDEDTNKEISDEELIILERTMRIFYNRYNVNSDVINNKLGVKKNIFWDKIYPVINGKIFGEVPYKGGGNQKRLRIICQMERIQNYLEKSKGDFQEFIKQINYQNI
jgi:hypothetical protein